MIFQVLNIEEAVFFSAVYRGASFHVGESYDTGNFRVIEAAMDNITHRPAGLTPARWYHETGVNERQDRYAASLSRRVQILCGINMRRNIHRATITPMSLPA